MSHCTDCTNGDIRLAGNSNALEGRVEICYDGVWGTVCSNSWGVPDATVVCRQLGYSSSGILTMITACLRSLSMQELELISLDQGLVQSSWIL